MKSLVTVVAMICLTGCAFFSPPNEEQARQLEEGKARFDRDRSIAERALAHEKEGMSGPDARALAETEYLATGAR